MPKVLHKKKSPFKANRHSDSTVTVCGCLSVENAVVKSKCKSTKIIAETDVGFGNTLYIRGAGCGLSWDKGVAMKIKGTKSWIFDAKNCKSDFEYKLLINDEIWSSGENFVAKNHENNEVSPIF